jgi:hypothetical protein
MTIPADEWVRRLQQLRLLSVEMLGLAQTGGWDAVTDWEEKRQVLLEELFQREPPAELAPQLDETIRAVLASDVQLRELARGEMNRLRDLLKSCGQSRRARQAYQDA